MLEVIVPASHHQLPYFVLDESPFERELNTFLVWFPVLAHPLFSLRGLRVARREQ